MYTRRCNFFSLRARYGGPASASQQNNGAVAGGKTLLGVYTKGDIHDSALVVQPSPLASAWEELDLSRLGKIFCQNYLKRFGHCYSGHSMVIDSTILDGHDVCAFHFRNPYYLEANAS
jgi:hypothetical protein